MSLQGSPEIDPRVHFLFDLLKWVRKGRVRVPGFQRRFVWRREQMLDLFDSVRRHYPIGTLLFWRSRKYGPRAPATFGPFILDPEPPAQGLLLVLDGHQRLATLAGALLRGGPSSLQLREDLHDVDPGRWEIYFDAASDTFIHLRGVEPAHPWQVPVWALVDTVSMFQQINMLYVPSSSGDAKALASRPLKEYAARLQAVGRALQTYKVPVVELETDDLKLAVDSFLRVNHSGQILGPDELFASLAWEQGEQPGGQPNRLQIAPSIDQAIAEVRATGFGEPDRALVLRTILLELGADPHRTDWEKLTENKRQVDELPAAMLRARAGLLAAVQFVRAEGIHTIRLLPYGLQLVGLAAWLAANPQPSEPARRLLRRWLWLTSAASWFSRVTPARYTRALQELQEVAKKVEAGEAVPEALETLPWTTRTEPFPSRYDLRSARVRSLLCVLFRDGIAGLDGKLIPTAEVHRLFAERGPAVMRAIWARCPSPLVSSPANRIFDLWPQTSGQARAVLSALSPAEWDRVAGSQLFAATGTGAPAQSAWESALRDRQDRMAAKERAFLTALDLRPPEGVGSSPIDADGEGMLEAPPPEED